MMKIAFEYTYENNCYGYISIKNKRYVEAELKSFMEIELPPSNDHAKVITQDFKTAEVELPSGRKYTVGTEKMPFKYSEFHQSFGDSVYYDLSGTVRLIEE